VQQSTQGRSKDVSAVSCHKLPVGMPSGVGEAVEGLNTDTVSLTRHPVSIDALGLYTGPKRILISTGLLPMAGGPCPCFAWALAPRPSSIAAKDDIQLAEATSWDSQYKQLWSDGINSGTRRKPQRIPDDTRLTITFGHKDTSKVRITALYGVHLVSFTCWCRYLRACTS
jgi:hypothetical protein